MDHEYKIKTIANKLFKLKKLTPSQETFAVNNIDEIKAELDRLNKTSILG